MTSATTSGGHFDRKEPIPGYQTTELLGRGGYGEVWKAIAPGGIAKAVKIIYGDADPTKAEGELRALARVKDVRHPLLLSIERIEMNQGNLIIVTELADGSLKDRFVQLRQKQAVGVSQDELLRYIGDAADALDFLYENFSLQHLDVKPENILLLSGRAKLGDFGLVKNLYERSASLVGGLTPTYAAPELFEGKPNRHSDQYSLALVYFQMLTGTLPFTAGNTAQLANAHLRGIPNLSPLPRAQRSVIARALSKDPAQRFNSCGALVTSIKDSLRQEPIPDSPSDASYHQPQAQPSTSKTVVRPAAVSPPTNATRPLPKGGEQASVPKAAPSQPPVNSAPSHAEGPIPPVLIGVGGLGVEVIARLVDRLNDRFGPAKHWPPVEIIVLDSHTRSLNSRFREQDLDRVHIVPLPIKAADDYGAQTPDLLKWLGRKWFYNIPRDLTTGGYRPFGRLALISNGARVKAMLTKVLGQFVRRYSPGSPPPPVTILGGIGGGTGSGAIPDLAYAVRSELKQLGLPHEQLRGILLHATPRSLAERDKSRANAHALLRELNHYSAPGGHYPGEMNLNALPFHGDNAAFGETLLFHLGEELGPTEFELAVEQTAEFLFAANFTPAKDRLHAPDYDSEADNNAPLHAHRAQVIALGAGGSTTIADAVRIVSDDVVRFWRDGRRPPPKTDTNGDAKTIRISALAIPVSEDTSEADEAIRQHFQQAQLELAQLVTNAAEVIRLESGQSLDDFLAGIINQAMSIANSGTGAIRAGAILDILDRCLISDILEEIGDTNQDYLFDQIVARLNTRHRSRVNELFKWVIGLIDSPDQRLDGARRMASGIQKNLQALRLAACQQAQTKLDRAKQLATSLRSEEFHRPERRGLISWGRTIDPEQKCQQTLLNYATARLDEFLFRVSAKIARIIEAEVLSLIEVVDMFSRDLNQFTSPAAANSLLDDAADLAHCSPIVLAYRGMLRNQLQLRRYEVASQIDDLVSQYLASQGKPLSRFLEPSNDLHQELWRPVLQTARRCVMDCIQSINRQLLVTGQSDTDCGAMQEVMELLRAELISPSAAGEVGMQCLLVPVGTDRQALGLSSDLTVVEGPLTDITLCHIERGITLAELADQITGGNELYQELGGRLQTRCDIPWRDLAEPAHVYLAPDTSYAQV